MAKIPSRRPWWWLAELAGVIDESAVIDCPWCGGPAEIVPWHPASSVRTTAGPHGTADRDGTADPGSNATAGIAFVRASCLFGHWFLTPVEADDGTAPEQTPRTGSRPAGPFDGYVPYTHPSAERGRR